MAVGLVLVVVGVSPTWLAAHPSTQHKHKHNAEAQRKAQAIRATAPKRAVSSQLTIELSEAKTGAVIPGLIRVTNALGKHLIIRELLSRGTMLKADNPGRPWHVLLDTTTITLPREPLVIEAFAGLAFERARHEIDLTGRETDKLTLPLTRFFDARAKGLRSGNTHLHLMNMTRAEADRYLETLPRGDHLELVFLSHLRRIPDEQDYISNTYTPRDMAALDAPDLRFGWGEEHRHNFGRGGEGYGHVMLLNINQLVRPVSIGPGIMRGGTDGPPLMRGIRAARSDGGTVVWCHNQLGFEDVPNWLAGTLDAQNIFDGGSTRDYDATYYRYMNIGLSVPFSTGTDWFLYDFSRAYVHMDEKLTAANWLRGLSAGKSFITNGPLFEFTLDGHRPGDTITLKQPGRLPLVARAVGRSDFGQLEIVQNGSVIAQARCKKVAEHWEASVEMPLSVDEPGWVAVRIDTQNTNEMGEPLFGHTSAIYQTLDGKRIFQTRDAAILVTEMQQAIEKIIAEARFRDDAQQEEVLDVYHEGIRVLRERIRQAP
jgi:hypothetical protein